MEENEEVFSFVRRISLGVPSPITKSLNSNLFIMCLSMSQLVRILIMWGIHIIYPIVMCNHITISAILLTHYYCHNFSMNIGGIYSIVIAFKTTRISVHSCSLLNLWCCTWFLLSIWILKIKGIVGKIILD